MTPQTLPSLTATTTRLCEARHWLDGSAQTGLLDAIHRLTPLLGEVLARSWQRSQQADLANAQGMLPRCLGDAAFVGRAERVALRPGAHWAESHRSTNAIGTALAEGQRVVVRGGEHDLARHGF